MTKPIVMTAKTALIPNYSFACIPKTVKYVIRMNKILKFIAILSLQDFIDTENAQQWKIDSTIRSEYGGTDNAINIACKQNRFIADAYGFLLLLQLHRWTLFHIVDISQQIFVFLCETFLILTNKIQVDPDVPSEPQKICICLLNLCPFVSKKINAL